MEFEQMLQEAEEPSTTKSAQDTPTTSTAENSDQPPQPRRKAKTKIGNKSKKKKKSKATGKPDGEEQYEVCFNSF